MSAHALAETLPDLSDPSAKPDRSSKTTGFSLLGSASVGHAEAEFVQWPIAERLAPEESAFPQPDSFSHPEPVEAAPVFSEAQESEIAAGALSGDIEELQRRHAEELANLRKEHERALEKIRVEAADQEIAEFSQRVSTVEMEVLAKLEKQVAGVLGQVFGDVIAEQSIEMLCKWLKARLQQPGAMTVELTGPQSLIDKLNNQLGEHEATVKTTESDTGDLYVEIDDEVVATRLGEWRMMVEDCLR